MGIVGQKEAISSNKGDLESCWRLWGTLRLGLRAFLLFFLGGSLRQQKFILSQSGDLKSEMKESPRPCCLWSLSENILPCLFQLLVVAGNPWSLGCSSITPISASIFTCCLSSMCLCLNFLYLIRIPIIVLGPMSNPGNITFYHCRSLFFLSVVIDLILVCLFLFCLSWVSYPDCTPYSGM